MKDMMNMKDFDAPLEKTPSNFDVYRRRLPHFRKNESTYFVTWRLRRENPELTPPERAAIAATIRHFDGRRYAILLFVVMNDHVHVLFRPLNQELPEKIVHSWKSFTANRLQRDFGIKNAVWQQEYFDRIIRDADEFVEKANYIIRNPSKRWPEIMGYEWLYVKEEGLHEK